jgi:hypothetical protein
LREKISVFGISSQTGFWCNKIKLSDEALCESWDPTEGAREKVILFEGTADANPDTQLFISMFFDKYTSAPTRYKSTGGLYMSICNQRQKDQRKLENIFLLSLLPPRVPFGEVWEHYRRELVSLESIGLDVTDGAQAINHKVRLAMFKSDSPQRCELGDHYGVTAAKVCPRCNGNRVSCCLHY